VKSKSIYVLLTAFILFSMLLVSCKPAAPLVTEGLKEEPFTQGVVLTNATCGDADIIKEIAALDEFTVRFTLCKPFPAFLAVMSFEPFSIQPKEWIAKTGGGGELLEKPIGTGPYYLAKWERGDSITLKAFDNYWGKKALTKTAVIKWATESAARMLELQSGTAHEIAYIGPDDYAAIEKDPSLKVVPLLNPNVFYLGMTNTFKPFDDVRVRKAVAIGIDRQRIVDIFYPKGSEVASHFTPCTVTHGCDGDDWYAFDATAAKQLLADAGFPDGFKTKIYYRDVNRAYLPTPGDVAVEIQTQLKQNLNIDAEVVVMESGEFIDESTGGRLDGIYMLGWGGDYNHITNFVDFHFGSANPQFGTPYPEIFTPMQQASAMVDPGTLYADVNNAIKEMVPMVPIAHSAAAFAALADLDGANAPPWGAQILSLMKPADGDTVVFVQAAEPISLYCMDETDGESLSACRQMLEGLLHYNVNGEPELALAESYETNDDATVFTFKLRQGVKFHNGFSLDANDVVASFAASLDVNNPYHKGNTGAFEYPSYLFGFFND
jgi:peptide/nickel transport system substrate-binding protein